MNKTYHIFTHSDLDGMISLLVFIWAKPDSTFNFKAVSNLNVENELRTYLENIVNPKNIYLVDLSLRESFLEFDKDYIKFIDHHKRSEEFKPLFKNAKVILQPEYGSNCKMLYKFFDSNGVKFTEQQKKLILLGDDYDSSKKSLSLSEDLNILFWAKYKNNHKGFLNDFSNGFREFTKTEKNIIWEYKKVARNYAESLPLFKGEISFNERTTDVIMSFGENLNSLALDILMKENNYQILFFLNTKTQRVIMKQLYNNNPIDLAEFSKEYCEGNGGFFSAGGKMTELFMEMTKNFNPL